MEQETTIKRVLKTKNFSTIDNRYLRRNDLSWKAKGILTYILTLPDNWVIYLSEIEKHAVDGTASFRSGWNELKKAGYVERYPVRSADGTKIDRWETIVRENVDIPMDSLHVDFLQVENLEVENLEVENRKVLNTNITKDLYKQNTDSNMPFSEENVGSNENKSVSEKENKKVIEENFEKLWKMYPNKKGKPKAFTEYQKAIKSGTTDKEIANGIENYNREIEAKRTQKQYIAHGSTWFSQKRWLDDYDFTNNSTDYNPNAPINDILKF